MKKIISTLVITTAAMIGALPVMAQERHVSPHETISAVIDGNRVTITYGRPYTDQARHDRGPQNLGRAGALRQALAHGRGRGHDSSSRKSRLRWAARPFPRALTPFTWCRAKPALPNWPSARGLGGWGIPVDTKHDLAQVDLTKESLDKPVDQFTMAVAKNPAGGGVLKLSWESTQFSVPFTVAK